MQTNPFECVVIDAGARYGLHPSWAELRGAVTFHLFEMDPIEAARLTKKYGADANITVHSTALFSDDITLPFNVSQHRALNSLYAADSEMLMRNDYMIEGFAVLEKRQVDARKIDSLFPIDIHFLKLDVEGAELEVLKGAAGKLDNSVLGVRSEVCFAPVYKTAPMFGEIHDYLLKHDFELLNLDYSGNGNKTGRFTLPDRYGKLISTDAVWVVNNDRLFARQGQELVHDVVRFSLFLMLNGATDLAIDTLVRAVTGYSVSFDYVESTPLFKALHRKILLLFKSLSSLPMFDKVELFETYKRVFGFEFPDMNRFYESELFT
jgi:FkbM family methyltransferase